MTALWVDSHAPKTLDDYVWRDETMRSKFEEWIGEGALPHLLFSGRAGMGKTSLARLLTKSLNVPDGDVLFVKASRERKVDLLEDRITGFAQTYPMIDNPHGIKYIILDEADSMSLQAQKFLRSEMDHYSATVRFIMTCNYPEKIMPAISSRCQSFHFEALSQEAFILRVMGVLAAEKVEYDNQVLTDYIEESYPDLRRCIGLVQKNTVAGVLTSKTEESRTLDYMIDAVELFKNRRHTEARKIICAQVQPEEYPQVFRFLYENVALFGDTPDQQDDALVIIRDGLYKHSIVADAEINLSATIVQLVRIK